MINYSDSRNVSRIDQNKTSSWSWGVLHELIQRAGVIVLTVIESGRNELPRSGELLCVIDEGLVAGSLAIKNNFEIFYFTLGGSRRFKHVSECLKFFEQKYSDIVKTSYVNEQGLSLLMEKHLGLDVMGENDLDDFLAAQGEYRNWLSNPQDWYWFENSLIPSCFKVSQEEKEELWF